MRAMPVCICALHCAMVPCNSILIELLVMPKFAANLAIMHNEFEWMKHWLEQKH